MRIEIRSDSILIDGYVNAVARDSRPIVTEIGKCVEQIEPRAFEKALSQTDNVDLLLNHEKEKKLGSTKEGNLELFEDNIGLRAICTITDPEVIQKAKDNKLKGWSFGMHVTKEEIEERADNIPRMHVKELEIKEVSIIDNRMTPCYAGTSIEQRADKDIITETRAAESKIKTYSHVDYSTFENKISKLRKVKA